MKPVLMIEHKAQHFAPGASPETRNPAEYCKHTLSFGTQGAWLRTKGDYKPEELPTPLMLTDKPRGYYLSLYREFRDVEDKHFDKRLPVWVAKGAAWGTVALGAVLCSTGIHAHIGVGLVCKGLAVGATVGTVAGLKHTEGSMRPYEQAKNLAFMLHQMHEVLEGEAMPTWMHDDIQCVRKSRLGKVAFDQAYKELKQAGIPIASPYRDNH